MKSLKGIIKCLFLLGLFSLSQWSCRSVKIGTTKPQVILKLDDLWYKKGQIHAGWIAVMDFLNAQDVTGTIGIVGNSLEKGDSIYFAWIKQQHQRGHEIWNHGYCHCKPTVDGVEKREFRGTSYAYQLEQLEKTQRLAKEKLGLTLVTFGAPYNSTDSLTAEALNQISALKIWLFKETKVSTDKRILKRIKPVNIEYPVHIPDFEQFKAGYEQHKKEPLLVIQGHPRSWADHPERMEHFKRIVTFLKEEGVRFTTPADYAKLNF